LAIRAQTIQEDQADVRGSEFVDAFGIDLSNPLYPQVAGLGDRYFEWVHTPIRKSTLRKLRDWDRSKWPGSVRIFEAAWLEVMTHISWRLVVGIWLPVVVILPVAARLFFDQGWGPMAGLFVAGFFLWTLVEYVLHRWIFHTPPRGPGAIRAHFLAHGIHHLDPYDATRLVFPPLSAVGIALVVFFLLESLLPTGPALPVMSGLLTGYLAYDLSHYISHHGTTRKSWFRFLHRYHLAHHHREPDAKFGVSSPLWDLVFRTGSQNLPEASNQDRGRTGPQRRPS
jgi:sterol desaturase/sphingolipid hydroxylase (fatty acid hydroxylase superfamily)